MNWASGLVLYIMIWMLTLFAVLPIGARPNAEADTVTGWRGAPAGISMWQKAGITTIVATILFGIALYLIEYDVLSFRHGILAG